MSKKIITISREFGSGGRYIGEQLAKQLEIEYYDKEIIEEAALKTGFAKEYIEEKGEYSPNKSFLGYGFIGRNMNGQSMADILATVQNNVIIEAAKKGPCVIIGRNADYILKNRDDVINVFITGNKENKIKRICEMYNKSDIEAEKLIHDIDKKRSNNYCTMLKSKVISSLSCRHEVKNDFCFFVLLKNIIADFYSLYEGKVCIHIEEGKQNQFCFLIQFLMK